MMMSVHTYILLDKRPSVFHTRTVRLILIKSWLTKTILATLVHGVICVTG